MDDRIETRLSAPLLRPNRHIGMFWLEKLWLIIDWLQIYGLLWNAANSFPWPYLWIQWTSWTVWANLDYFSTTPDGALNGGSGNVAVSKWGQMPHYIYYAVGFSFPLFVALMYYLYLRRYYYRGYGVYREVERHLHLKYLLTASHLLYLPVSLAVFRLYYCDNADNSANGVNKLACDPSLDCLSTPHIIALSLGTLFMLPLVVGLPIITYQYISKKCVIYSEPQDHEKKLQVLEIMYALGLSETWIEGQMWMMSSFRRDSVYYRVEMLVMKLVLLGIFIYFRSDKVVQATLLWMVYTQYCMRYLFIKWPYRLNSSNLLLKVLLAVLLADVTFGLFNAMGAESAMLVASVETIYLLAINSIGLLLVLTLVAVSLLNPFAMWPADATLYGMRHNSSNQMIRHYSKWVACLRNYVIFRKNWYMGTRANADILGIEQLIVQMRKYWLVARSKGSIFENPLSDAIEDLLIMRQHVPLPAECSDANALIDADSYSDTVSRPLPQGHSNAILRRKDCWNKLLDADDNDIVDKHVYKLNVAQASDISTRTNSNNFTKNDGYSLNSTRSVESIFRKRDQALILMPQRKKRILTKLMALSALIGGRDIMRTSKLLSIEEVERERKAEELRKMEAEEEAIITSREEIDGLISNTTDKIHAFATIEKSFEEFLGSQRNDAGTARAEIISGFNDAMLLASLVQLEADMNDLVNAWNHITGLYESNQLAAVYNEVGDAFDEDSSYSEEAHYNSMTKYTWDILNKLNLTPYNNSNADEWYSCRMIISDRLEKIYNMTVVLEARRRPVESSKDVVATVEDSSHDGREEVQETDVIGLEPNTERDPEPPVESESLRLDNDAEQGEGNWTEEEDEPEEGNWGGDEEFLESPVGKPLLLPNTNASHKLSEIKLPNNEVSFLDTNPGIQITSDAQSMYASSHATPSKVMMKETSSHPFLFAGEQQEAKGEGNNRDIEEGLIDEEISARQPLLGDQGGGNNSFHQD